MPLIAVHLCPLWRQSFKGKGQEKVWSHFFYMKQIRVSPSIPFQQSYNQPCFLLMGTNFSSPNGSLLDKLHCPIYYHSSGITLKINIPREYPFSFIPQLNFQDCSHQPIGGLNDNNLIWCHLQTILLKTLSNNHLGHHWCLLNLHLIQIIDRLNLFTIMRWPIFRPIPWIR